MTIHHLSDHVPPPDHGCLGKHCPLCRKPRTVAEIVSLSAHRQAQQPREGVTLPVDCEPGNGDAA